MSYGVVVGLQRSMGGVPKLAIEHTHVSIEGLEHDWQTDRRFHGGPDRALCLYSADLIDGLRAEGHPIAAGSVGENITIRGMEWAALKPGMKLRIGSVVAEITAFAPPCKTIRASFSDRRYVRISEKLFPGWSRLYCRVLTEGEIAIGDASAVID